jgi:hypothetical protein
MKTITFSTYTTVNTAAPTTPTSQPAKYGFRVWLKQQMMIFTVFSFVDLQIRNNDFLEEIIEDLEYR